MSIIGTGCASHADLALKPRLLYMGCVMSCVATECSFRAGTVASFTLLPETTSTYSMGRGLSATTCACPSRTVLCAPTDSKVLELPAGSKSCAARGGGHPSVVRSWRPWCGMLTARWLCMPLLWIHQMILLCLSPHIPLLNCLMSPRGSDTTTPCTSSHNTEVTGMDPPLHRQRLLLQRC